MNGYARFHEKQLNRKSFSKRRTTTVDSEHSNDSILNAGSKLLLTRYKRNILLTQAVEDHISVCDGVQPKQ